MKNCTNITIKGDKHGSGLKMQIYTKLDLTFFPEGPNIQNINISKLKSGRREPWSNG